MAANDERFGALAFRYRGALLALPAVALAILGKPCGRSIARGLPLAFAGEFMRCYAVGYSGKTTRGDTVEAPQLVTAGPYAHVRNPLYLANFITAAGFALAFTGRIPRAQRLMLCAAALGTMAAVYSVVVPHEEDFLRKTFGADYEAYEARVPRLIPQLKAAEPQNGTFDPGVIRTAEANTFLTFGLMLAVLAWKAPA